MACAKASTETAIVVVEVNAPTPTSEHWKICDIYTPQADAGCASTS